MNLYSRPKSARTAGCGGGNIERNGILISVSRGQLMHMLAPGVAPQEIRFCLLKTMAGQALTAVEVEECRSFFQARVADYQ